MPVSVKKREASEAAKAAYSAGDALSYAIQYDDEPYVDQALSFLARALLNAIDSVDAAQHSRAKLRHDITAWLAGEQSTGK